MRRFALMLMTGTLVAAGAASACDLPAERPFSVIARERTFIDTAAFARSVADALGDRYMGYAVTLRGPGGRLIAQVNHGFARTPCEPDGPKAFNGRSVAPIGSISKALTAAVVVHRAERLSSVSLDDPFRDYLPRRWRAGLHPALREVSLRDLLQHKAGFAHSVQTLWGHRFSLRERLGLGPETYLVRARNIARAERRCVPAPQTRRCYSNTSFALWNISAASLRPREWREIEDGFQPGEIAYEDYLSRHVYRVYERVVRNVLFDPVGTTGGCNVYTGARHRALSYTGPGDERGIDRADEGRPCAVGGWFMSTGALSRVIHRLVSTREVIDDEHAAMFLPGHDRIVFASRNRLRDGLAVSHNGARFGGTARAEAIVFASGMVAAGIVNSRPSRPGPGLKQAVLDAYEAALPD